MVREIEPTKDLEPRTHEQVAILDAGAQYLQVIARKVQELGVKPQILLLETPAEELNGFGAIIISGGESSVYDEDAPTCDPKILQLGKPILGICWGMQWINYKAGGKVEAGARREDGPANIAVDNTSQIFQGLEVNQKVLMSHGDSVTKLAPGFRAIAESTGIIAAIENPHKKIIGVQFHPEVHSTANGREILKRFLFNIAGFSGDYLQTVDNKIEKAITYVREIVGNKKVAVAMSGGVDSSVLTALLLKALDPEQVVALHVDNGFMRLDESMEVKQTHNARGINVVVRDESEAFYSATTIIQGLETPPLYKVTDPEMKRTIIGDTFIRVFEKAMRDLGLDPSEVFLAQGTLRPDLIESASKLASGRADTIKTHHNDSALARLFREQGRLVEPLQDYHKDEVRVLGQALGLPDEIVWRHPFPGPGLAIRILCAQEPYITEEFDQINDRLKLLTPIGINATLLPVRTVGVQGDRKSYSYLVGLSGRADWKTLLELAEEIPKQFFRVNRVVYIFGAPIQGPIKEITPTYLTRDVIQQIRQADNIVNQVLVKHNLTRNVSQVPVVSFPAHFGKPGNRSIGIRAFISPDFMTGVPAIPGKDIPQEALYKMVNGIILKVPGISRVAYDLTSKPPGTTEWE